jgi:hypothetical protein
LEVNSMALMRRVRSPVAAGPRRICSERTCLQRITYSQGGHPGTIETDNAPSEGKDLRIERWEFKGHDGGGGRWMGRKEDDWKEIWGPRDI